MALTVWTDEQVIAQLDSDEQWYGPTITYAFPIWAGDIDGYWEPDGFLALTSTQQQFAKLALATWDDVMAPTLVEISPGNSDIEFGFTNVDIEYAHAYYPNIGSVWFSRDYSDLTTPEIGEHGFLTYIHEIGHALGLDHMGDYNGSGEWKPSSYQDSTLLTIMSYFGPNWGYGAANGEGLVAWADWVAADGWRYSPQTPMVNDIMAIQAIYGADPTTRTGNTIYGFDTNITGQMASLYDFTLNGTPILTLYDGGGIDTLNLSGWSTASHINLAPGAYSSCNSMTYNIGIAYSCNIENAVGGAGNDRIDGNLLANRLDGGLGIDTLKGAAGNDTYVVDLVRNSTTASVKLEDLVSEALNEGADTIELRLRGGLDYSFATAVSTLILGANVDGFDAANTGSLKLNLTGNTLDNTLTGNAADNILDGLAGADTLIGGAGNDTYVVDQLGDVVTEAADAGIDTVQVKIATAGGPYVLTTHVEHAILLNAIAYGLTGNARNNTLTGNAAANTLLGLDGNDILNGGLGADTLVGGDGDDIYYIDNLLDVMTDSAGTDEVRSTVSHVLGADFEHLTLLGAGLINATGNTGDNVLTGNDAANILDGLAGADTLIGGKGNDTYVVDAAGDVIVENLTALQGGGIDLVRSDISFDLAATGNGNDRSQIENLTLSGSANTNATGNDLNNTLTGNSGANRLNGGLGIDTLKGAAGNDTYVVDLVRNSTTASVKLEDLVSEALNEGTDTIELRLRGGLDYSFASAVSTLILGANVDGLDAANTGSLKLNLTGNTLDNTLTGNAADNLLNGLSGADTLIGGAGNDTYVVDQLGDVVTEAADAGIDTVQVKIATAGGPYVLTTHVEHAILLNAIAYGLTGNARNNTLTGNAAANTLLGLDGNDILNGGLGADTLVGGDGDDIFRFETALSSVSNVDTIQDFTSLEDVFQLENSIFTKLITTGQLGEANFRSGDNIAALDANDYILYDTASGALYYDADGSGAVAKIQFATLIGQPPLNHTDFFVT